MLPLKFRRRITVCKERGCWLWTGQLNRNGYGRIYESGAKQMAHRRVYQILVGRIGTRQLDHVCCVRRCVNPRHLQKVTNKENSRRRSARAKRGS